MCYHVAIVVELRANIANYFDLKVKAKVVKQTTIKHPQNFLKHPSF
jgi:hypothetical protein